MKHLPAKLVCIAQHSYYRCPYCGGIIDIDYWELSGKFCFDCMRRCELPEED